MRIKNYILFLLSILFLFSCGNNNVNNVKKFKNFFIYDEEMPVVNYKIGKHNINFIVDTGSDVSIIDDDYYLNNMKLFNFVENNSTDINTISGTVSSGVIIASTALNDSIDVTFYITDIDNIRKEVFVKTGRQIQGILGCDFLYQNKAIIDFNKKELRN